jgi:hypothetical protein
MFHPHDIAERMLQVRVKDSVGLRTVMTEPVRFVTALS